jgi:hypothetical protein
MISLNTRIIWISNWKIPNVCFVIWVKGCTFPPEAKDKLLELDNVMSVDIPDR